MAIPSADLKRDVKVPMEAVELPMHVPRAMVTKIENGIRFGVILGTDIVGVHVEVWLDGRKIKDLSLDVTNESIPIEYSSRNILLIKVFHGKVEQRTEITLDGNEPRVVSQHVLVTREHIPSYFLACV